MKKTSFCISLICVAVIMTMSVAGRKTNMPKEAASFTKNGEILGTTEKYDMFYKSDEIKKIIQNNATKEAVERQLGYTLSQFQEYPEYEDIKMEDLEFDLYNYYVSPVLTVEKLVKNEFSGNGQYYFEIVIPVYLKGKNVDNLYIYYDANFHDNIYVLASHSSYRVYSKSTEGLAENASIFDFVSTEEQIEKLVKNKLGEDTEIYNRYLLLGIIDAGNKGIQEDNIYIETSKGACVFVSASCSFSLSGMIDFKNNALYTLTEYITDVQPDLYPKMPKQEIEYNEDGSIKWEKVVFGGAVNGTAVEEQIIDKKFLGIKGGYVIIPSAVALLIVGTIFTLKVHKKKKIKNNAE